MIPGLPEKQNVVEAALEIEQTAARYFASSVALGRGCVLVTLRPIRGCNGWNRANETGSISETLIRFGTHFCHLWHISSVRWSKATWQRRFFSGVG